MMTNPRIVSFARPLALCTLALLAVPGHAIDWSNSPSAPAVVPLPSGGATMAASGVQSSRRAPALSRDRKANGGQVRIVERELRLDSLNLQVAYDKAWVPERRIGDAGGIGIPSLQVVRRAVKRGVPFPRPSCVQGLRDRITVPLAASFRIKSVNVDDNSALGAQESGEELFGPPASFRVTGAQAFEVQPSAWYKIAGNAAHDCWSRYTIASIRVFGPEGIDPLTGKPTLPGPR